MRTETRTSSVKRPGKQPDLQCDNCGKPSWYDEYDSLFITCNHCNGHLRKVTDEEPLVHLR
ncbi:hypothetical protein EXU30_00345 [Shewanella maritima]|uniref:Uncharacterized protein n=1 Tax=Shewanella maritima TaxID=2520507 RepID=A0A411PCN7_9GAMM|nr:hypothetical protein [Shewanella maritima]QBF81319.1 hypothetical protein EXU30_00345 [Shewanella maritima]